MREGEVQKCARKEKGRKGMGRRGYDKGEGEGSVKKRRKGRGNESKGNKKREKNIYIFI